MHAVAIGGQEWVRLGDTARRIVAERMTKTPAAMI
jgi:hypothetical protein